MGRFGKKIVRQLNDAATAQTRNYEAMATKVNPISRFNIYVRESWDELKKVHAPSKQETIRGTIGVLLMVFFFGLFLGLTDLGLAAILQWLLA